jgi:hypothetical protein
MNCVVEVSVVSNPLEALVECPFYITNKRNEIYCEGPIANADSRFVFKTMKAKTDYIKNVCSCNHGKKCLHYRAMMIFYERGVLGGNAD